MGVARGDRVRWMSGHNSSFWFKGVVQYFIVKEKPPTEANTFAVIDDGLGLTPRVILVNRLHRQT